MDGTEAMTPPSILRTALGAYGHTEPLKSGAIGSSQLRLDFADVSPISRAFAPMVRDARFDVCEMAIATALQARAYGKPLVLLPVTMAARFQEAALLCRTKSAITGPAGLAGLRVGVRAYSQTTGMWLRGTLAEDHGVRPQDVRWVTFEGAHVAEYQDPPWATRAAPGQDMLAMLHAGELDAAIFGNDLPNDPALRPVFPDPAAAGQAFLRKHGFLPVNHLVVVTRTLAGTRPDLVAELLRMFQAACPASLQFGRAALQPAIRLALRYCTEQGLLPTPLIPDEVWGGLLEENQ